MFSTSDTIVAVATPPGRGGIGVVRLSGSDASRIAQSLLKREAGLVPRRATLTIFTSASGVVDQVVTTFFRAPRSYTGEDVVELSAHGSPVVLNAMVEDAMSFGARLAEPGEFTLRAFLNQRIDLPQAEAVVDLVDAVTPLQARAAFDQLNGTLSTTIAAIDARLFDLIAKLEASVDFPDEGYHFIEPLAVAEAIDAVRADLAALLHSGHRGRVIREGRQIVIVGAPNAGKSSLFNAVVGAPRAIVAATPGTTRDMVTETVDIEGVRVTLVDTAGLRESVDDIEAEGVARSRGAVDVADLVWVVVDGSELPESLPLYEQLRSERRPVVLVSTKSDRPSRWQLPEAVRVSVTSGEGLQALKRHSLALLGADERTEVPAISNLRHLTLVQRAADALERASKAARVQRMSEEFVLADLQEGRSALEQVVGRRTADDLLGHIFSRFCVGK